MLDDVGNALHDTKLILVVPVLDFGGVESRVVIQSALMRGLVGEIRVCCLSGDGVSARDVRQLGVPVDVLSVEPNIRNPRAAFELWRYFRRQKPDIVHACTGAMTIHAIGAAALAGVPIRIAEEVGIPKRGRLGRALFPLAYRAATDVVGVSDAVVDYLIEKDGVSPSKAVRIYNTVDEAYFRLEPPPSRAAGALRVVSVGRLVPEKAHDVLMSAMQEKLRDGSTSLSIVGDGPERLRLEALARALGIESRVRFVGHSVDVQAELMGADVFVLCSRSEGLPLALLEAMGARVPVIASAIGGIPEILSDSELSRWLVPPGDVNALAHALDRMMDLTEGERESLGKRAHDVAVSSFGQQRYVNELVRLYSTALERENHSR